MSSTALEFGLINTFRTGNWILDTLVCMIVPVLIQRLTQNGNLETLWSTLVEWVRPSPKDTTVTRQIEVTQRFNQWGKVWDYEQKNHMLQKAISVYLGTMLDLRGKNAQCELVEKPKTAKDGKDLGDSGSAAATSCSSDDGYESDDYDYETGTYRGEIFRLSPTVLPPKDEWIVVEKGVEFMHEVTSPEGEDGDGKGGSRLKETKIIFWFRSTLPDGSKRIDALVNKAFANYQDEQRKQLRSDESRYFYIPCGMTSSATTTDAEDGEAAQTTPVMAYKRYALGEDKSFDNLFFPEKKTVLELLDNFTTHQGKFAIKGFPYKLGLLLHGPPGTGKTSLIKAVAQHTKRHIVTINLSKVKTNQELMDAVFDLKFAVDGMDSPVELSFKDVVFVMEDIDCASSVVSAREGKTTAANVERLLMAQQSPMSGDGMPPLLPAKFSSSDKLNLSGLLNVLDGVIDSPGRIVILTTNHPEKLDPALIRPGRVNKKLLLDFMGWQEMQEMIEYYCLTSLTGEQTRRLRETVGDSQADSARKQFTPAEVEEFCAEFDDVDSILDQITASIVLDHQNS